MRKFSSLLRTTYYFTQDRNELPSFLERNISKLFRLDILNEGLLAACWIDSLFSKGKIFVIVTHESIISSDSARVKQNKFTDLTGVERDLLKNVKLLSSGNSTTLFSSLAYPADELLEEIFIIINKHWSESKARISTKGNGIEEKLNALMNLKDKGLITDSEFEKKRSDILSQI